MNTSPCLGKPQLGSDRLGRLVGFLGGPLHQQGRGGALQRPLGARPDHACRDQLRQGRRRWPATS